MPSTLFEPQGRCATPPPPRKSFSGGSEVATTITMAKGGKTGGKNLGAGGKSRARGDERARPRGTVDECEREKERERGRQITRSLGHSVSDRGGTVRVIEGVLPSNARSPGILFGL